MKYLILLTVLMAGVVNAQTFSPSASGSRTISPGAGNLGSPTAMGSDNFNSSIPNNNFGQTPLGNTDINQSNTAPTAIPSDNSLINSPSNNPMRQSQEEFNTTPTGQGSFGSETNPGLNQGPVTTP